jgi:phage I-like protein
MSDKRKKERGEAIKSRLSDPAETEEPDETAETSETGGTSERSERSGIAETKDPREASETAEMAESSETVKSRKNVNMYLPEGVVDELNICYSELDAKFQREHGRSMEKNRDYYPAVIEAGLTDQDIETILDLE